MMVSQLIGKTIVVYYKDGRMSSGFVVEANSQAMFLQEKDRKFWTCVLPHSVKRIQVQIGGKTVVGHNTK